MLTKVKLWKAQMFLVERLRFLEPTELFIGKKDGSFREYNLTKKIKKTSG